MPALGVGARLTALQRSLSLQPAVPTEQSEAFTRRRRALSVPRVALATRPLQSFSAISIRFTSCSSAFFSSVTIGYVRSSFSSV